MYRRAGLIALSLAAAVLLTLAVVNALHRARMPASPAIVAAAAGLRHGLALWSDGTVTGWGYNKFGQVGDGTGINRSTPKRVRGLPPARQVAAGSDASFALARDGSVWAWGAGYGGERSPLAASRPLPVRLNGVTGAVYIAGAGAMGAAVLSGGSVKLWYVHNEGGPNNTAVRYLTLAGIRDVRAVAIDGTVVYALIKDGTVVAAETYNAPAGRFRTADELRPAALPAAVGIEAIAVTEGTLFLLQEDGSVLRHDAANRTTVRVSGLKRIVAIAAARRQLLSLGYDGTVWQWDYNAGPLAKPNRVKGLSHVIGIYGSATDLHFALKKGGKLFSWGIGMFGSLGQGSGSTSYQKEPVEVLPPLT